ncbi:MAG: nicotinamide-nucleotide amidohydrolase family protein [Gaiellaceae bacterium]
MPAASRRRSSSPRAASSRLRSALVITGSELVRGDRTDRNGPFLARELVRLGLEPASITIVGDDEHELEAAFAVGLEADLCVVSGGLGPTHDDRTVELVARAAGLSLHVDEGLRTQIGGISRAVAERLNRPYADFEAGVRKQATLPHGAVSLGLAGTAPGLVLRARNAVVIVLPGPPAELQRLWPRALETDAVRSVLAGVEPPEHRVLRFYGASESEVARALTEAGGEPPGVVATICARDFEIHVDLYGPANGLANVFRDRLARHLFAEDERGIEEVVLDLCRARGWTLATAESCTGGMVAARLTSVPGSSDVFLGSVVSYANEVKERELGVPRDTLERYGAVSEETAAAMSAGVRERLGADVAVSVTGIAGPGGGTADKPVGLVHLHAQTPEASHGIQFTYGQDRDSIRRRATVAALHLLRRLLTQNRDERE